MADARVEPGPAAGRLATVENVTVNGMQEFVACRDAAVGEPMYPREADDLFPARQPIAQVLEILRIQVRRRSGNPSDKRGAGHARGLKHLAFVRAQPLDARLDQPSQAVGHS